MDTSGHIPLYEDYVSFETAKLLKEKGFRAKTNRYYNAQYGLIRTVSDTFMTDWNDDDYMKCLLMAGAVAIPTLQMAMKWLREVHGLFISIGNDDLDYGWQIFDIKNRTKDLDPTCLTDSYAAYIKYEAACEAAIKYCLENLI